MNRLLSTKFTNPNVIAISSLLISVLLISFGVRHSYYLYIQVLGSISVYFILRKTEHLSIISILLLGFLVGVAELVLVGALASILNILIRPWLIGIPFIILVIFLMRIPIEPTKIRFKVTSTEVVLIFFTFIALVSRVFSIRGFFAPILHDPISHATWASDIVQTGLIKTFYSPGLHIVCAFGNMIDSVSTATYVLRLTNILNALLIIPVFYFLEVWLNKKYLSVLGTLIFLVSLYPARFFWTAGKNALVMNLPFFFLVLFFYKALQNFSSRRILLVNLLLFISIINHYPFALIILIGLLGFILSDGQLKHINTVGIGTILGLTWGISKLSYFSNIITSVSVYNNSTSVKIQNVFGFFTNFIKQTQPQFVFPLGDYVLFLSLVLMLIIMLFGIKKREYRPFTYFIIFYTLVAMIIFFFQPVRNYLYIVYETQVLTFFLLINTTLSIVFGELLNRVMTKNSTKPFSLVGLWIFVIVSLFSGKAVYAEYREHQSNLNMVSWNDVSMFNWIDNKFDTNQVILNNAAQNANKSIVFTSDGASWIPAFTDNEIAMPFDDFGSIETHENYQIYSRLLNHSYTCQDLDLLISRNINYYYLDSNGVFGPQFEPGENDQNFRLINEIDGVELYEILPCTQR
jgi:hypothetical protein